MTSKTLDWHEALPSKTITAWVEFGKLFLRRFYFMNNFIDRMTDIIDFKQGDTKSPYDE